MDEYNKRTIKLAEDSTKAFEMLGEEYSAIETKLNCRIEPIEIVLRQIGDDLMKIAQEVKLLKEQVKSHEKNQYKYGHSH